jgi:hypothetical protein
MRLACVTSARTIPVGFSLTLVLLGLGVALVHVLSDGQAVLCRFRTWTGVPCPTCGSTRAVMSALRGDLLGAFVFNPLTFIAIAALGVVVAVRAVCGRQVTIRASGREWTGLAVFLLVALGLNWVWVLRVHGML